MYNDFDLSDPSRTTELDQELRREIRNLQQSQDLHRIVEEVFAGIDAVLKRYEGKGLTREHLARLMLANQEMKEAEEKLYGHRQVNVGDIQVTGHIHIVKESEKEEGADVG